MQEPTTQATARDRLLAAALRLLAAGGPETLQARRLAAEVGASTMAVYTHFGGMGQLITEVVRAGYISFGQRLAQVLRGDDPVADLLALGMAYRDYALENPQLYRLMFGTTAPVGLRAGTDPPVAAAAEALPEARAAFAQLIELVARVMEASGGPVRESPGAAAFQVWSAVHGYVLLEIAGFIRGDGQGVNRFLLPLLAKLTAGVGADPAHAARCARQLAASRQDLWLVSARLCSFSVEFASSHTRDRAAWSSLGFIELADCQTGDVPWRIMPKPAGRWRPWLPEREA